MADILPEGTRIAYFRGRKLHGKALKLPSNYRGVVASTTERLMPRETGAEEDGHGEQQHEEAEAEVKIMEEQSSFEEIVVWGHEVVPDGMADPYVRGVEDWIGFAEQVS